MLRNLRIGPRLVLGFAVLLALIVGLAGFAVRQMSAIENSVELLVDDRLPKVVQSYGVIDDINTIARVVRNVMLARDSAQAKAEYERIQVAREGLKARFDSLEATVTSEEGKNLLAQAVSTRKAYAEANNRAVELIFAGRKAEATDLLFGEVRKTQAECFDAVKTLIDYQKNLAEKDGEAAATVAAHTLTMLLVVGLVALVFGILAAWLITSSIVKPLGRCIEVADKVAAGDLSVELVQDSSDEMGRLTGSLATMVGAIRLLIEDMNRVSTEHDRGEIDERVALERFQGAFRRMAEGVNKMVEGHIDLSRKAMGCVAEFGRGNFEAALERFPGKKASINETVEQVRANLKALIEDASMLARAAVEGRLATRADASRHQGDFRRIVQGVNDTLDAVIGPLNVAAACVDRISKGDIPPKIDGTYHGDFNQLKGNLNQCIEAVNQLVEDAARLASSAVEGQLSTRADASRHQGDFRRVVQGVNETLDAVIGPVNEAASVLERLAARDLSARVQGEYRGDHARIKSAVNRAAENLDQAIQQVAEAAGQVSSASQQISAGSQSLAQGANEQASSLEEVSASLEEMSSMTRQSADNAAAAKSLASEADQSANQGGEAMQRMNQAIGRIKESSDQTAKIVKTIDEIAMQTNLLALNAAVEAARAGEAGRGFAVVAEEVRNLAQRSAQAAKNTADMIGESVRNADDGVKIATEVSKSFENIAQGSKKVNELIAEIAAASKEQSAGITQVSGAVQQMDKVTQQVAANSEESASASEQLSSQAEELQSMVAQFRLSQGTPVRRAVPAPRAPRPALPPPVRRDAASEPRRNVVVDPEQVIPMDDAVLREF